MSANQNDPDWIALDVPIDDYEDLDPRFLTVADVEGVLWSTHDERITYPAQAWLAAYELGCWLGFNRSVALNQAAMAWDRAAESVEIATRLRLPEAS